MHGILVALALLLGVSARDPTTCPERVLPVPGYTTAWLAPLSYFKCPNASNIPDKAYLTQYSAEYPTRADSWTQNCSDSYIWADGTSQAGDFNSYCCSSDQIKTWILSTTPSGYLGEISALCDDANQTVLPSIRSGWNDTSTCSNALDDAENQTDPHYGSDQNAGIYTLRTVAETYQFLGVGTNVDAYQYTFQCPPGLRPIGFGARSACYSLKDIKVLCAASDNSTTGLAPGLNRERKNCTNTGLKPATDPIGEPGPWLWEGSGIFNPSRSSPYYSAQAGDPQSDCCNVGRIEKWYLVNATDARFSNYSLGQISATCSDGTVLSPITFGHNGTNIDCKLIRLFLNGGRTVATPADGNFPYMTSDTDGVPHLVQSFLTSNPSEAKVFQCPNDTQPIGYSAAPACLGLTQLQVLCGNPIDSIPAPAPAPTPSSTTLPISQSSHQKDSSALSGGAIAGIVIGVLAGLGFAVFLLFFAHRMLRQRRPESPDKTMELRDSGRSWSGKDRGSSMLTHPAHDSPPLNSEASTALGPQAFDLTAVPFSAAQRITDGVGISSIWVPLSNSTSFRGLPSSWEIPLANVKLICSGGRPVELGRGGFGIVLRAKVWNGEAAIKMIKGGSAAEHARLLHEIKILESCRSTQIVQFLGYSITSDGLLLCMEFMPNGTLFSALGKSPEFQWYNRGRQAMLDVTAGLFFLHSRKLSHNDLKTPNVLIGGDMRVKIADLGLGKLVNGINTQVSQFGTFAYLSPEFLTHGVCGLPSDIWAFSTILIEVCTLRRPTRGMQANDITVPDQAPAALVSLIRDCRAESPEDRPTVEEICERLEAVK